MSTACRVILFDKTDNQQEVSSEKVVIIPKFKKDGTPKNTKSNSKKDRENVEPFKLTDVDKMIQYFKDKVTEAKLVAKDKDKDYQVLLAYRNLTLFVMGINVGIRVGDLLDLTWDKLYNEKWEMLEYVKITPEKTSRYNKKVLLAYNSAFRIVAEQYRNYCKPKNISENIFIHSLDNKESIEYNAALYIIKTAAKSVNITYPVGTHSMRKTFARQRYERSNDKSRTLIDLMQLLKHKDPTTTLAYIGITLEEQIDLYNEVNLGLEQLNGFF